MKRPVSGGAFLAAVVGAGIAIAGCSPAQPDSAAPPSNPPIAGGWSPAGLADSGVRAAAGAAVAQLLGNSAALKTIDTAEQQVVAGINYHLTLTLTDGARWDVIVWRKLDGQHALTGSTRIGATPSPPVLALDPGGLRLDSGPDSGEAIPFGTDEADVLAALAFRGKPERGTNAECGAGPVDFASWQDGLSLLFQEGRFQGWSLDERSTGVAMADGTRIGSTLAELRSRSALTAEESTLGEEFLTAGGVSGLLSGKGAHARVEALWAGLSCVFR